MPNDRVLIAGGGIGGLSAALGLARKGVASIVLEKAAELSEIGAGIQLGPNAFHAFDALGVGPEARECAVYVDALRLMDAVTAQPICSIGLGEPFRTRFANPYAVVHRAQLHGVLRDACCADDLITLRTSASVEGYETRAQGVVARLSGGDLIDGALLIGADGLWSNIRAQMLGDPVRVSGHSTYRSVIPADDMPEDLRWNAPTLWAGPKCHIVHYPLQGGTSYNLVVTYHNDAPAPVAGQPVQHDEVARGFDHISDIPKALIQRGSDWRLWVLCDRDPAETWTDGPVALLGDAAHPTLQYMAQGACMAMEDAICLADELGQELSPAALQRYAVRRQPRTAKVVLLSREVGTHIYHPDGAHAALRNKIMSAKTDADWYDSLGWLYGSNGLDNHV